MGDMAPPYGDLTHFPLGLQVTWVYQSYQCVYCITIYLIEAPWEVYLSHYCGDLAKSAQEMWRAGCTRVSLVID